MCREWLLLCRWDLSVTLMCTEIWNGCFENRDQSCEHMLGFCKLTFCATSWSQQLLATGHWMLKSSVESLGNLVARCCHRIFFTSMTEVFSTLRLLQDWQQSCNRCVLCIREAEHYFFLVVALEGTGSPWLTVRCFRSDYASNECLTIPLNYIRNLNKGCQALWQMKAAQRVIFKNAFYRQSMCCLRSFSPAVLNLSVPLFVCASTYN